MLKFRIIARLDIKAPNLIKTRNLEGVRVVGDPALFAGDYNDQGIDEIYYNDAVASLYGRNSISELVIKTSECTMVPIAVGGGIRTVEDAREMFLAGADKIVINSAAVRNPDLIEKLSLKYGSQSICLQLDYDGEEAFCDGGRQRTGRKALDWASEAVERGAGEILATSINREGTSRGCDISFLERLVANVSVPVVASGGVGSSIHVAEVAKTGCSGVAIAGLLHYKLMDVPSLKAAISEEGVAVRL